jgi:hypothetical protein
MSDVSAPPADELVVPFRSRETVAGEGRDIESAYDRLLTRAREDASTITSVRRFPDGSYKFVVVPQVSFHNPNAKITDSVREIAAEFAGLVEGRMNEDRLMGERAFGRDLPEAPPIASPGVGVPGPDGLAQMPSLVVMYKRGSVYSLAFNDAGSVHTNIQQAMQRSYVGLRPGYDDIEKDLPDTGQYVYVEEGAAREYTRDVYAHFDTVLRDRAADRAAGTRGRTGRPEAAAQAQHSSPEFGVPALPEYYMRYLRDDDPLRVAHRKMMELTSVGTPVGFRGGDHGMQEIVLSVPVVTREMLSARDELLDQYAFHFAGLHQQAQRVWGERVPEIPLPQYTGRDVALVGGVVVPRGNEDGVLSVELGDSGRVVTFGEGRRHLDPLLAQRQESILVEPRALQAYGRAFAAHIESISAGTPPDYFNTVARLNTPNDPARVLLPLENPERLHDLPPDVKATLIETVDRIPGSESVPGPIAGFTSGDQELYQAFEPVRQLLGQNGMRFEQSPLDRTASRADYLN